MKKSLLLVLLGLGCGTSPKTTNQTGSARSAADTKIAAATNPLFNPEEVVQPDGYTLSKNVGTVSASGTDSAFPQVGVNVLPIGEVPNDQPMTFSYKVDAYDVIPGVQRPEDGYGDIVYITAARMVMLVSDGNANFSVVQQSDVTSSSQSEFFDVSFPVNLPAGYVGPMQFAFALTATVIHPNQSPVTVDAWDSNYGENFPIQVIDPAARTDAGAIRYTTSGVTTAPLIAGGSFTFGYDLSRLIDPSQVVMQSNPNGQTAPDIYAYAGVQFFDASGNAIGSENMPNLTIDLYQDWTEVLRVANQTPRLAIPSNAAKVGVSVGVTLGSTQQTDPASGYYYFDVQANSPR